MLNFYYIGPAGAYKVVVGGDFEIHFYFISNVDVID